MVLRERALIKTNPNYSTRESHRLKILAASCSLLLATTSTSMEDKAGPSKLPKNKRKNGRHSEKGLQKQSTSIEQTTRLPKSLQQTTPLPDAKGPKSLRRIKDKKLRAHLNDIHLTQKRAAEHAKDVDNFLYAPALGEESGLLETEHALERTARVTQREIRESISVEAAKKSFSLDLSGGKRNVGMGPYRSDYSYNGRHLLLGGRRGHIAAVDWQTGKLLCEVNVSETVRDVTWLHNQSFFAVAQKKYTYIYDSQGTEVHQLKAHIEVKRLEFLRYHFLLATIGNAGYLKYQDTSTGNLVAEHRTGLGPCSTMAQNPLTAVIHLGHSNGTVTLWTPNLTSPALKMLAHRGPVSGISISRSSGGREMATSSVDGSVKLWDSRMLGRGAVREWLSRRPANDLAFSQRGLLGVAWGNHVSIYDTKKALGKAPPGPYLTNGFPRAEPISINFCPFEDVLGVSHGNGFDSLIVPGAGEPRFDSSEADPFETKNSRREREVHSLLDKIQPDTITLDPEMLGQLDVAPVDSFARESVDESRGLARSADGRPFSRLTRMERLRLQGKADEGEKAAVTDGIQGDRESSDDDSENGAEQDTTTGKDWNEVNTVGQKGIVKEKHKMRGRNSAGKKYHGKQLVNVEMANAAALRAKNEQSQKEKAAIDVRPASALAYLERKQHKRPRAG
jgi:U3 small nucleolar RNA-associated protein 7